MIRLRPLRPREMRSIRHWAIELAVVVVGVLLALWAAEWAEARRQAADDARIMDEVRSEVRYNLRSIALFQAQQDCLIQSMGAIKAQLLDSGTPWVGYDDGRPEQREGLFDDTMRASVQLMTRDQYQRALAAGTVERLAEAGDLRQAYSMFDMISQSQVEILEEVGGLRPLSEPISLGSGERVDFLGGLARIDERLGVIRVLAPLAFDIVPDDYRRQTGGEREDYERLFTELAVYQGECLTPIDAETGEERPNRQPASAL